jgi:hypothetical protein
MTGHSRTGVSLEFWAVRSTKSPEPRFAPRLTPFFLWETTGAVRVALRASLCSQEKERQARSRGCGPWPGALRVALGARLTPTDCG